MSHFHHPETPALKLSLLLLHSILKWLNQCIKISSSKQKVLNNLNARLALTAKATDPDRKGKKSMLIIYLSAQPGIGCKQSFSGHGNRGRRGPLCQRKKCASWFAFTDLQLRKSSQISHLSIIKSQTGNNYTENLAEQNTCHQATLLHQRYFFNNHHPVDKIQMLV